MERDDERTPPRPGLLQYQSRQDSPQSRATSPGGIRLFRAFGITVFLHWSWFLVAYYEIQRGKGYYSSIAWTVAEYLALFGIVLMHEFGHALACRSVGGKAERIVLWPLGGVAYVTPPPRPGAMLWSIAAGPLVNVVLLPITYCAYRFTIGMDPDWHTFAKHLLLINTMLLIFNMLPIYPLDGGQILQSLLWFIMGRAKSLMVVACIGILGAVGILSLAIFFSDTWFIVLAIYAGYRSWTGIQAARAMLKMTSAPLRREAICPSCGKHPPIGPRWACGCGAQFDTFETGATCPRCGQIFGMTRCIDCGQIAPLNIWMPMRAMPIPALAPAPGVRHPPLPPAFPPN
jgi:Zn-dependent protease